MACEWHFTLASFILGMLLFQTKKKVFQEIDCLFTNLKVQKEAATVIMDSILIRPFWKSCLLEQKQLA